MKKRQKRIYEKPEMKIYGNIENITGNAGDWGQDASTQSS